MIVLGLDTATATTSVAVMSAQGTIEEAEDVPAPGARGRHAERVLSLAAEVLQRADVGWEELGMVAVGLGPGGYTGLRIGLATARGLAMSRRIALSGVGTLRALAEPVRGGAALSVIDARRGELFTAAYVDHVEVLPPTLVQPAQLAALLAGTSALGGATAVGDGARIHRELLEGAGLRVPAERSPLHRVSAGAICRLAAAGGDLGAADPVYLRRPDAERTLAGGR